MTLLDPYWLHALWAVAVLALVLAAGAALRRRALARFYGRAAARPWAATGRAGRRALKGTVALLALAALALALARPAYDPQPRPVQRRGRDVLFLIDVSRSMLAEDIRPNRLERAKLAVQDVLDAVEGDRVGVVAFAGAAALRCPLTSDYAFARLALDDLNPDSVARGGTAIGDAIRLALTQFFPDGEPGPADPVNATEGSFRDIFLFTDGEDHESFPVEAAQEAGRRGVRIIAIGIGSDTAGATVPTAARPNARGAAARAGLMQFDGEPVRSRLDTATLERVAAASAGGRFLNVGTGTVELDSVYRQLMASSARRDLSQTETVRYTEVFQWLVGLSLGLLLAEPFIGTRRRTP